MSEFLEGGKSFPRTAKAIKELVGTTLEYVLERNIDKSGRGYYSVNRGLVKAQTGKISGLKTEMFIFGVKLENIELLYRRIQNDYMVARKTWLLSY